MTTMTDHEQFHRCEQGHENCASAPGGRCYGDIREDEQRHREQHEANNRERTRG